MEKIQQQISTLSLVVFITLGCTIAGLLLNVLAMGQTSDAMRRVDDKINVINCNVRGIDESITSDRNIDKLLKDFKELRMENEKLSKKLEFYREKYEK